MVNQEKSTGSGKVSGGIASMLNRTPPNAEPSLAAEQGSAADRRTRSVNQEYWAKWQSREDRELDPAEGGEPEDAI